MKRTTPIAQPGKKSVFVVNSGWVFLCDAYEKNDGAYHLINASTIRKWGTTKGLGELAIGGPTKETIMDPCGTPIVPAAQVLFILPCTY